MIEQSWQLPRPIDIRRTLRFVILQGHPVARRGEASSSYALVNEEGPATVTVSCRESSVMASAVGSGAALAVAMVPRMLGLDDESADSKVWTGPLDELNRRYRSVRLGSTGRVFDALLPVILGQRVTTSEAKRSYRLLCMAVGRSAPGDLGLLLPPGAKTVATMAYEDFHRFGVERSRAQTVIEISRRASRLEEIMGMKADEARVRLAAVRGIGPWTTGQIMGVAWGDPDAVPIGDYHLPNTVAWLLAGEVRGTDKRMLELLEPYRPYRRRAIQLIKLAQVTAPRFGPKGRRSIISHD